MATKAQVNAFIEKIAPIAINLCKKRSKWILPSVTIAQAACESAWGTSKVMAQANGLFGFKVGGGTMFGSAWKGKSYSTKTKEFYGNYITITDNFRAYDSVEEAVEDYMDLLCNASRYKAAVNNKDALSTITAIKKGGYATSPTYIDTIMNIINSHDLTKYDASIVGNKPASSSGQEYTVGKNYVLQANMFVRKAAAGANKLYKDLTKDGQKNGTANDKGYAILKQGTVVTCLEVKNYEGAVWIRIPSGWICGIGASKTVYVK